MKLSGCSERFHSELRANSNLAPRRAWFAEPHDESAAPTHGHVMPGKAAGAASPVLSDRKERGW
jgi:hypothetical protein